jgi:hypothetical protein
MERKVMANSYSLLNFGGGLVIDVQKAATTSGTLDAYTQNSPATDNQLWTFEAGPASSPNSFFIKSKLGHNLAIGVKGGKAASGTALESLTQISPASNSQLWKFSPVAPVPPLGFIQCLLGHSLVIDISGEKTVRGTTLDVWSQGTSKPTQLWFLIPASGNSYNPKITSIVPAGFGFTITGTGLQAGSQVLANYQFTDLISGGFSQGTFVAYCDLGGTFVSDSRIDELVYGQAGTLLVQILISSPAFPKSEIITAQWDGSTFKI